MPHPTWLGMITTIFNALLKTHGFQPPGPFISPAFIGALLGFSQWLPLGAKKNLSMSQTPLLFQKPLPFPFPHSPLFLPPRPDELTGQFEEPAWFYIFSTVFVILFPFPLALFPCNFISLAFPKSHAAANHESFDSRLWRLIFLFAFLHAGFPYSSGNLKPRRRPFFYAPWPPPSTIFEFRGMPPHRFPAPRRPCLKQHARPRSLQHPRKAALAFGGSLGPKGFGPSRHRGPKPVNPSGWEKGLRVATFIYLSV